MNVATPRLYIAAMPKSAYQPSKHIRGMEHRNMETLAVVHHVQALQRTANVSVDRCIELYLVWYGGGSMARFDALRVMYFRGLSELREIMDIPDGCKECPPVAAAAA